MPKPTHDDERKGRPSTSSGRALMVSLSNHAVFAGFAFFVSVSANAQTPPLTTSLPPITVTAQKEPQDPANLPVSVTAVLSDTLTAAGLSSVSQAGWFAPNTFFNEFTARKLSNPRFRGVGSSPNNPGITSSIEGVPQLNANSSSIEFLDVEQVEFVRGPQSALFGRNALGGIINITSARPSLKSWNGSFVTPYGNFNSREARGTVSGPIVAAKLYVGFAAGYSGRDGFTKNDITGHDLDSRSAEFGRGQILRKPNAQWEARARFSRDAARPRDDALHHLGSAPAPPVPPAPDAEGFTRRDIVSRTGQPS